MRTLKERAGRSLVKGAVIANGDAREGCPMLLIHVPDMPLYLHPVYRPMKLISVEHLCQHLTTVIHLSICLRIVGVI